MSFCFVILHWFELQNKAEAEDSHGETTPGSSVGSEAAGRTPVLEIPRQEVPLPRCSPDSPQQTHTGTASSIFSAFESRCFICVGSLETLW